MPIIVGDRVSCPPNEYGLEDLSFLDCKEAALMMERRLGVVEQIPDHGRFICVRIESISGKPIYLTSFDRKDLTKL